MRHDLVYLILLVISAAIFAVFICPYLQMYHMGWICYVVYGIVIIVFLYGRAGMQRRSPPRS